MRIHSLHHVPFEGLGSIEPWAQGRGHELTSSWLHAGDPLPSPERLDWLVVMGGPMGVNETERHPWLVDEKSFIEAVIAAERRVLGICLGAQLVAEVLGARVRPNPEREIGWFPVETSTAAQESTLFGPFPSEFEAFHWHGDTFEMPQGAVHVARSTACENQAFVYEERVAAIQFHLETTLGAARALVTHCGDDLVSGPFVQDEEEIFADPARFARINVLMEALLVRLESTWS